MSCCIVPNCNKISQSRGLCKRHYLYAYRHNSLPEKKTYKRPKRQKEETLRFWERVDKNNENSCWIWLGRKNRQGYGEFVLDNKKTVKAHRHSFLLVYGYLDKDKFVCHSCDNPSCVNLNHLWQGTAAENNYDCRSKSRAVPPPDQKGENHSQHILKQNDVLDIRSKYSSGVRQAELMREYAVSRNTIYKICNNLSWKHIGEK
jgi:hypothetical protein